MLTLGNLVCGFFAIVVASRVGAPDAPAFNIEDQTNLMLSGWLILLAMVFDALDGYVARLAAAHDFTLYEYFQTDRAGHDRDMERAVGLIQGLDRALPKL